MRWRRLLLAAATGLGLLGTAGGWILSAPRPAFPETMAASLEQPGDFRRGKLIFDAGGCASCHASPGQTDRLRLGGGLTLGSPLGSFYPPNISPDTVDGIGHWRTIDLANALLAGVAPDGQHYYPALPYTTYTHMRVEDVQDLMAYLRTLPAVKGRQPPHDLPLALMWRRPIGLWKLLYLDRLPLTPVADRDAAWHRGRYLVEAVSHCAECHSARDMLNGIRPASRFAGAVEQEGVGFVPNITALEGEGWTQQDLLQALTIGLTPDLRQLGSSMADVVTNMAALPLGDQRAIVTYIFSLPPGQSPDTP